jgi:hypothetical protein
MHFDAHTKPGGPERSTVNRIEGVDFGPKPPAAQVNMRSANVSMAIAAQAERP